MTKLPGKVERGPSTLGGGFARLRDWVVALCEGPEAWVNSLRLRIRPPVSLLTGSLLVLLTLYLPTAVGSCGSPELGLELASGGLYVEWPGFWGWLGTDSSAVIGRGFYLFCLALAALTLISLLVSVFRRNHARKRVLFTWLLAISGSVAFVSTTNLFVAVAMWQIGFIIYSIVGDNTYIFFPATAFILLLLLFPVACLRPEFWKKKGAAIWTLTFAGFVAAAWCGDAFLPRIFPRLEGENLLIRLTFIFATFAVSLLPLGLWFRYGLFGHAPGPLWPGVTRRLAIFYAGAVTVDFLGIAEFSLWGLVAFFLGVYLIFFGYWQLRWAMNGSAPG